MLRDIVFMFIRVCEFFAKILLFQSILEILFFYFYIIS